MRGRRSFVHSLQMFELTVSMFSDRIISGPMNIPEGLTPMEYVSIMEKSMVAFEFYKQGQYHLCLTSLQEVPEKYLRADDHITRLMAYLNLACYSKCYDEACGILSKVDNDIARRVLVQSCLMTGQYSLADSHIALLQGSNDDIEPVLDEIAEARSGKSLPVWVAAMGGHIGALDTHLQKNDVNATYTSGRLGPGAPSLLFLAAANGRADVVTYLLSKGADANFVNLGWTALHIAVLLGYVDVVVALLEGGANINIKPTNVTPVQLAVVLNNAPLITLLAARGADIASNMPIVPRLGVSEDVILTNNSRVMHMPGLQGPPHFHAAAKGHEAALTALLAAGGWDVLRGNDAMAGATLLHMAAGRGAAGDRCFANVVQILVRAKADVNAKTHKGYTALHFAARTGDDASAAAIDILVHSGADLNANTALEETPLVAALCAGSTIAARKLLTLGADVCVAETRLRQPLAAWAVLADMPQMLAAVLEGMHSRGGDEAARNMARRTGPDGVSALHWACLKGDFVSVALLLRYGADVTAEGTINGQQVTPLRCARLVKVGQVMGASAEGMHDCEELVLSALQTHVAQIVDAQKVQQ